MNKGDDGKFDFDSDPDEFPECWESGEDDIVVDVQGLINKHVWLALNEYICGSKPSFHIEEDGTPVLFDVVVDGSAEKGGDLGMTWYIEPAVMEVRYNYYGPEELQKAAASLRRCAEYLESLIQGAA